MTGSGNTPRLFYGWVVVGSAHLVLFTIFGVAYSFSSYFTSLQDEFQATRAATSFAFSITIFVMFLTGVGAGIVADRTHVRWVTGFGVLCLAGGAWTAAQAQSLTGFYFAFGIGVGLGVGCAYVPAIAAVQPWFIKRRGLAAGIASAGIGLGTLVGPLAAAALIQQFGWRATLTMMAGATLLLGAAALLLEKSPQTKGLYPDNDPTHEANLALTGMRFGETMVSREFRLMFLAGLAMSAAQFMPFVHLARHALDRGFSPATGALLLGVIGIGSFAGRFVLTGIADKVGNRNMLAASYAGMGIGFGWWLVTLALPPSVLALGVFAFIFGTSYGAMVGVCPPLCMDYFGGKSLSGIIGALYFAAGIGSLFAPTFAGWMYDVTQSYVVPLMVAVAANFLAAWIAMRLPRA